MCVVTRRGSPCARCRNINGVFNCFWLRSVGWVWVKPIRRLEETVKDCLRKRALTFLVGRRTEHAVVCYRARLCALHARLLEHTLCLHLYECFSVCVYVREGECPLSSGRKKMSYGISDYVLQCFFVQYLAFFFFSPLLLKLKATATSKSICRLKSDPELWSDLEPKQREKQCRETSSLVLRDLCGAWISPIVLHSQNSVSGWREKRSVKNLQCSPPTWNFIRYREVEFPLLPRVAGRCVAEAGSSLFIVFGILSNSKSEVQHSRGRQKHSECFHETHFPLLNSCCELYVPPHAIRPFCSTPQ